ncbi:hypothetical protein MY3296_000252 [Beauveria thailandica]
MPPPPDLSSYRLSAAESQRIFQEEILPAEFPVNGDGTTPAPYSKGECIPSCASSLLRGFSSSLTSSSCSFASSCMPSFCTSSRAAFISAVVKQRRRSLSTASSTAAGSPLSAMRDQITAPHHHHLTIIPNVGT